MTGTPPRRMSGGVLVHDTEELATHTGSGIVTLFKLKRTADVHMTQSQLCPNELHGCSRLSYY